MTFRVHALIAAMRSIVSSRVSTTGRDVPTASNASIVGLALSRWRIWASNYWRLSHGSSTVSRESGI